MRTFAIAVAGTLILGSAAWAADNTGPSGGSGRAPGHEMGKQDGKMQGPPNAAGYKRDDATGSTGTAGSTGMSRSGTSNSTGATDAGSGASAGARGGSGSR
ncbi:hypothetical protein [Methylobacterium segetis]|uniref:hypothetical protein n=1 Tax=Methylobacterium segetis TaxID=2488750 RepID=UPI00104672AD|nr:hypothetical protein [Methylobacterium segetis]